MRRVYRALSLIALLALLPQRASQADPIHAVADGAYWHHGSGWIFPEKVARYIRVGIPQDVAGSEDAVAWYAFEEGGERRLASVDVYLASSAAAAELEAPLDGPLISEGTLPVTAIPALAATKRIYSLGTTTRSRVGLYVVHAGDWRVRICITGPEVAALDSSCNRSAGKSSALTDASATLR
jgi:hypothetical protein